MSTFLHFQGTTGPILPATSSKLAKSPHVLPATSLKLGKSPHMLLCHICNKQFRKQGMLDNHLLVHKRQSPHVCLTCNRNFCHKGALKRHKSICVSHLEEAVKQQGKEANCPTEVSKRDNTESKVKSGDLEKKMRANNSEVKRGGSESQVTSTDLELTVKSGESAVLAQHKGSKAAIDTALTPHKCSNCQMVFSDREQLYHHKCMDSNGERIENIYMCKVCNHTFTKIGVYRKHMQTHHTVQKTRHLECIECNRKFVSAAARQAHMISHRKNEFKCNDCLKTFRYEVVLAQHVYANHDGPMPYSCTLCTEKFPSKIMLTKHASMHQNKRYKCEFCRAEFPQIGRLREHRILSHKELMTKKSHDPFEEAARSFKCTACEKSFYSKKQLKKHGSVHKAALKCEGCNKEFQDKQKYVTHFTSPTHSSCKKLYETMGLTPWLLTLEGQESLKSEKKNHSDESMFANSEEMPDNQMGIDYGEETE